MCILGPHDSLRHDTSAVASVHTAQLARTVIFAEPHVDTISMSAVFAVLTPHEPMSGGEDIVAIVFASLLALLCVLRGRSSVCSGG